MSLISNGDQVLTQDGNLLNGVLSNGTNILKFQPDLSAYYDYVMLDADGNIARGVKSVSGLYQYAFTANYADTQSYKPYNLADKFITPSALNDNARCVSNIFNNCRFMTSVGNCHFNNVTSAMYVFTNCLSLTHINDNSFNGLTGSFTQFFNYCSALSALPANSFNAVTAIGAPFNYCSSMKNLDGMATSFEKCKLASNNSLSAFTSVSSNLIPVIDHFMNKSVPLTGGSAHLFSACTGAADYAQVTASPTYSGWV